ncbi:MAG: hypothetical protein JWN76_2981 [Chitinophagaceae bacterium]|nr:hypothetical protein [Chitinophagaceae bacterium]
MDHGGTSAELKAVRLERETIDKQIDRLEKSGRK